MKRLCSVLATPRTCERAALLASGRGAAGRRTHALATAAPCLPAHAHARWASGGSSHALPIPESRYSQLPPITQPLPGLPDLVPARSRPAPSLHLTTLPNGLRIACMDAHTKGYAHTCTIALFVDAGCMYERESETGAAMMLEALSFKQPAPVGVSGNCVVGREAAMMHVHTHTDARMCAAAFGMLADSVRQAMTGESWTPEVIEDARSAMQYMVYDLAAQPQNLVTECLYASAYTRGAPLGRPERALDKEVIAALSKEAVLGFTARTFHPSRMVLAVVGLEPERAIELTTRHLAGLDDLVKKPFTPLPRPVSPYVGGDTRVWPNWAEMPVTVSSAAAKTGYTHVMLAFPTTGWADDDVVPTCVVDTLLGGGSSFSAGGPGKGMYTRLYREVLNSFSWVEACNAFSVQQYDSGLLGIYAAAPPDRAGSMVNVMSSHLARLTEVPVRETELARARNQLAGSVMMNLETRGLLAEDIGRQILSHGKRLDPSALLQRIRSVTAQDIMRVMRKALESPPSFAAVGDARTIPEYEQLRQFFTSHADRSKERVGRTRGQSQAYQAVTGQRA